MMWHVGDSWGTRHTRRAVVAGLAGLGGAALAGDRLRALVTGTGSVDRGAAVGPNTATRLQPPARQSWATNSIGTTAQGRSIEVLHSKSTIERTHVMVIGAIHGNEPVSQPIIEALRYAQIPDDMSLTLIPTANPDGSAARTRRNSRGVDLNRNFPWRWSRSDGGPGPASELETQALMHLIRSTRLDLVVWVHQPLAYVAPIPGCPWEYADAWGGAAGIKRRVGLDQHGGSETWTGKATGVPSILVEVPTWKNTPQLVASHVAGFEACAEVVGTI